jgi:hypothetical protein
MTLTRRGEKVVATLAVFGLVTFLLTCAIIGQNLKHDRLEGQVNDEVASR